jgi:hypothetical protein
MATPTVALPPTAVLEFQDSEVRCVAATLGAAVDAPASADGLIVSFSAAYVCAPDGGAGYMPSVELAFSGARWQGPLGDCVGRLSGGTCGVNGAAQTRLPLPFAASGPVSAELRFANGAWLQVSAKQLDCRFVAVPTFVEDFRC